LKRKINNLISDKKFSEILQGSVWSLGARVIATAAAMITSIIMARFYGAEVVGIVAVLNSFLMLTTIFTVLGTNTSILRLIPEHLAKYSPTSAFRIYRKTQYFVAGVSVITGGLLFFTSEFIADRIFSKPHLQFYLALGAGFIVFKSLMILNTQAVRGVRLIRVFAFMQFLPPLAKLIILAPITILFFHKDNPIYAMFASITITAVVSAWVMDREFKKKTKPDDHHQPMAMKEILTISTPMLMSATMAFVIGQTGVVMLGMFRSDAEVGYYAIAVKLATLTSFIIASITTMAAPKIAELFHSDNMSELFYVAKKATKLVFWTTTPILLCLIVIGKPILAVLYGNDFTLAYGPMVLLTVGQFINAISGLTFTFMNMTGHQKIARNIVFISAFLNISLNILLTPSYGPMGAALAGMICMVFGNLTVLLFIKKKYGKSIGYFPLPGKLGF